MVAWIKNSKVALPLCQLELKILLSPNCLSRSSKFSFHLSDCLSWSTKFSFHLSKRPGLHKFWFVGYNFLIFFFTCSEKSVKNFSWLQCLIVNLECWKVAFLAKNQSYRSKFVLKWTKPKSKQMCLFTFFLIGRSDGQLRKLIGGLFG